MKNYGIDVKADEFYRRLRQTDIVPSTSAPSLGEISKRVEEWKAEGCTDVIHFPISFGLSAYGENLLNAFDNMVEGINLHVFNCHSACLMEGYCAHYAEILAERGYTVDEIMDECQKFADQTVAYFVVDDLNQFYNWQKMVLLMFLRKLEPEVEQLKESKS